jgi:hypothetical protein
MKKQSECKGVFFRADVSHCETKKGILFSVRLNLLKRKSCPGCRVCGWLFDSLGEIDRDYWPIIGIESCKHSKLYALQVCNISTDWETGIADSWDLKVVEVEEEKS